MKLLHNIRVFLQRRKARKIVAAMKLDQFVVNPCSGDCHNIEIPEDHEDLIHPHCSELMMKIENKRYQLGLVKPHEDKVFSVVEGNKTTWYRQQPGKEPVKFKEVILP